MLLRFIGTNGSMGLIHGEKYYVSVSASGEHIYVRLVQNYKIISCPYSSPQSFAANWEKG